MKIETNNYSQPIFNASLILEGNTKFLGENGIRALEFVTKRIGSYSDIINIKFPNKIPKNEVKASVTGFVGGVFKEFNVNMDKRMILSGVNEIKDKLKSVFFENDDPVETQVETKVKTEAEIEAEKRAEEEAKIKAEEEAKIKAEKKEKITTDKLNEILDFSKNIENLSQEQSIILVKSIENLLNNPVIKDKIVRKVYNLIMSDKELLGGIIERVYSGIIGDDYKMQSITGRVGYLGAFESNPITYHARHSRR